MLFNSILGIHKSFLLNELADFCVHRLFSNPIYIQNTCWFNVSFSNLDNTFTMNFWLEINLIPKLKLVP